MEKGSKRAGTNRNKAGNSYKKDTDRTGGGKAYNKRDSFRNDEDRPKRPSKKDASFGDERPKRTFTARNSDENDRPRKQWDDRESGRPKRSFDRPRRESGDNEESTRKGKTFGEKRSFDKPRRSFDEGDQRPARPNKSFGEQRSFDKPRRSTEEREQRPARANKGFGEKRSFDKPRRSFEGKEQRPARADKDFGAKRSFDKPHHAFEDREDRPVKGKRSFEGSEKPSKERKEGGKKADSNPFREPKRERDQAVPEEVIYPDKVYNELEEAAPKKREFKSHKTFKKEASFDKPEAEDVMPLNKFIAHSGECSRRDAADLVRQGKVKVNGELILDPGYKVNLSDDVTLIGKKLKPQKGMVYILLNKPKGFITTNDDPQGRKTVMDLVSNSGIDRLFAVGRLDRNTTGLLLLTNDGVLAQKLAHPSYQIKKVYHVTLDKPLTKADFDKVVEGVTLDDGIAHVDEMAYLEAKNELGLEIHSGRNRIVRRIFESLGYEVEKLDRVMYAGLTKKNLPRSKWRFLEEKEVVWLKHFKS